MIVHFAYILQALPLIHIVHFALIFERANTAHSASTTSPAFAQKVPFLKIPLSFPSLIPCLTPPTDEREKTERTTAQLPVTKKCCLLIFAIAIGCLVLADFPASFPSFPFLLAACSAGSPKRSWRFGVHFAVPPARFLRL